MERLGEEIQKEIRREVCQIVLEKADVPEEMKEDLCEAMTDLALVCREEVSKIYCDLLMNGNGEKDGFPRLNKLF